METTYICINGQYIDGLALACSSSIANTLELLQLCNKPMAVSITCQHLESDAISFNDHCPDILHLILVILFDSIPHEIFHAKLFSFTPISSLLQWIKVMDTLSDWNEANIWYPHESLHPPFLPIISLTMYFLSFRYSIHTQIEKRSP